MARRGPESGKDGKAGDVGKAAETVRASITEAIGKLSGDKDAQAEGALMKRKAEARPPKKPSSRART